MSADTLDEILERIHGKPADQQVKAVTRARKLTSTMKWVPNPGPQTDAYLSQADVLLFGGEPGGGKTNLVCGLAYNCHRRARIMRRLYDGLSRITADMITIHGSRDGFNNSPPPKLVVKPGHTIDFAAAQHVGDEQGKMGQGVDLLAIDEATQFAESQIRFLMGWVRTENPNQRTRTVLATNPPLEAEGMWIIKMFAPWLDPTYHSPAMAGELRWAVYDDDDKMIWVDGPEDVFVSGRMITPKSYTYIPSSMEDNPYYAKSNYKKELDALPAEIRRILMGGFKTSFRDQPNQVIPTAWIRYAIERHQSRPPDGVPMCAIAADMSGGGVDPMVLALRYDGWYAPHIVIPGKEIPMDMKGRYEAGIIVTHRRNNATVIIDMGGGYGGAAYEHLKSTTNFDIVAYKGAEGTQRRSREKQLAFKNTRTASLWTFREALDPDQVGGSPISLPNDPECVADLAAPTYEMQGNIIVAESKVDVCARLGRSTNKGDATVMSWWAGPTASTDIALWDEHRRAHPEMGGARYGRRPRVITGRQNAGR